MATKNGIVKKTPITDYANVRKTGLAAITLREDDELIEVKKTDNEQDIFLVTKYGQCIRFNERCQKYRKNLYGCDRYEFDGWR